MRQIFIWCLLCLLPLRLLAADAMVLMPANPTPHTAEAAHTGHGPQAPCHQQDDHAVPHGCDEQKPSPSGSHSHASCDVCHNPTAASGLIQIVVSEVDHVTPDARPWAPVVSGGTRILKPPIA